MKYIVDGEQMRQIDKFTIETIGIPPMVLMENAANALVEFMIGKISKSDKILAICGTGNNGGDGAAAARLLRVKGFDAAVLILGDEKRASDQTKIQLRIARNLDVPVFNNVKVSEYNVIIDAIFGIGLSKPVDGIFKTVIEEVNQQNKLVFSVDIPSGIDSATGKVMNEAVQADYTVTFGYNKKGIVLFPGCEYAGIVKVADIGFSEKAIEKIKPDTFVYERKDLSLLPRRMNYSHKGTYGRVLVIAGSKNMSGAGYLSSKAAYRTGVGLVKIMTAEDNRYIIQTLIPEAILSTYNPTELKSKLEVDRIIKELEWATSVVIGPGIGLTAGAGILIDIVLNYAKIPVVMDADALNIMAEKEKFIKIDEQGVRWINLPSNVIITPHLKEMSRLLDCQVCSITEDIVKTATEAVKGGTFTLALKDARTIVTNGKQVYINTSGNHGMATGGSGDVLSGIIGGLLAQGLDQFEATTLGVYIHGAAADYAVEGKSCYSLMAGDIIEALPYILNDPSRKQRRNEENYERVRTSLGRD